MLDNRPIPLSKSHHGIVLNVSQNEFDKGSVAFGSIFVDEESHNNIFLFYAGAQDPQWSHSSIGLAVADGQLGFKKVSFNPVLDGYHGAFCSQEATTPAVIRLNNKFYMVFAGKPSHEAARRIGIAYADDPKGPWHIIGEILRPTKFWEGNGIDIGPSILKIDHETILVYYSSITSPKTFDIFSILRRYPIRRIGLLKVRIRGTSRHSIEAMRFSGNPLKHLNGSRGSWNESVFCPGYTKINDTHYLFPTGSTYSVGFPYKQYLGVATSSSPYFSKETQAEKLIDGPAEKTKILPNTKNEIALDTPSPHYDAEKQKLFLYYSVADRADETWKIALTTFDFRI